MFKKNIDTNDRSAMIKFLSNHSRYYTMNSWNRSSSYANNVKIYNLAIPADLVDKAYDFVSIGSDDYDLAVRSIIHDFYIETGYNIGSNGRSGGYLVLYDDKSARSIDKDEDFNNWGDDELRDRVKLVSKFDECCDDIIDTFIDHLKNCTIGTIEVTRTIPAVLYNYND